jgi:hypothetical protein
MDFERIQALLTVVRETKDMPTLKSIFDEAMKELHKVAEDLANPPKKETAHGTGYSQPVRSGHSPTAAPARK